ncbi:MAG: FAD-dependent oxidoreductase [Bacteroidia bacterium]|nr:FAD-dependent oxidoreductase [Bacteroidia bacterium]
MNRCVIIGAGHAAAQLAPSLRQYGWTGEILVIGEEPILPYNRPTLSKEFLLGKKNEDQLFIRGAGLYEKSDILFLLNTRVEKIDRQNKTLLLDNGDILPYTKLAITTGARVRKLSLPGATLPGVFYLRNLGDSKAIRAAAKPGGTAVVVGGGYIGLEVAAALRSLGMKVQLLEAAERLLSRVTHPLVSAFYNRIHQEEGVEILTGQKIVGIEQNTAFLQITTTTEDGLQNSCDLIVVGVGVEPETSLAQACGLEVGDGIVVNEYAQTSDPDIVAAGDCTWFPSHLYGYNTRLESVPHATDQAKSAAAAICGQQIRYEALPWFWSEQYDVRLQIAGLYQGYDEIVVKGEPAEGRSFTVWYLRDGKVIAADCVNRPKDFIVARQLIPMQRRIAAHLLADENYDLRAEMK